MTPFRKLLAAGCALAALGAAPLAHAQPGATLQTQERRIVIQAPPRVDGAAQLNPTNRTVTLTVPARDGATYLGDVVVTIDTNDQVSFSAERLLDVLSNVVDADVLRTLRSSFAGGATLSPGDFEASGIRIQYNPLELALDLIIASEKRVSSSVQVSPMERTSVGDVLKPAPFSAYLNVNGNLDYLHNTPGEDFQSPTFFLNGAMNFHGAVLESEGIWQPDSDQTNFQRLGSRLVYDDQERLIRWTAGDLQPTGRSFQSAPEIAGLSIFRSYGVLQPQRVARPRGDRTFFLERAATVEVQVNGQIVRRLQLQPGNYDLRDFPFVQGANDVRLVILDDAGRSEVLRFNVFLDNSQLGKGLSEFGAYVGVLAPIGIEGPHYTSEPALTGYYRRGVSDRLTLGGNVQADRRTRMGGVEAVWSAPFGAVAANLAVSDVDRRGSGYAALVTLQRQNQTSTGRGSSLNLFAETRSRDFAPMGVLLPLNPFEWEVGGGYSIAFTDTLYGGFDGRYSKGRDEQRDVYNARGTLGWRISERFSLTADVRYRRDDIEQSLSALISGTMRLGRFSNLRADYDTLDDRARLAYTLLKGQGVGAYNIAADVEHSSLGSVANVAANYYANRGEFAVSHFAAFDEDFGLAGGERTSVRYAGSIAYADGAVSVGRPIYDSFAIVRGHKVLKGAEVVVDPSPYGDTARTGAMGAATHPGLSSYAERTITINAPEAPSGVDLGQGAYRLFPTYRSGYRLEVGSDYSVTAIGRLLNGDGEAISLITGTATELAHPDREPVVIFTNREGRFGATGLAPGRWRIDMLDGEKSSFIIDVPAETDGVLRVGDLRAGQKDQ